MDLGCTVPLKSELEIKYRVVFRSPVSVRGAREIAVVLIPCTIDPKIASIRMLKPKALSVQVVSKESLATIPCMILSIVDGGR